MSTSIADAVSAFLTTCRARNLTDGTIALYRRHLADLAEHLTTQRGRIQLDEVAEDDLETWFVALRERPRWARHPRLKSDVPLSSASLHAAWRATRTFFAWARKRRLIPINPMEVMEAPRREKKIHPPLTDQDVDRLLDVIGDAGGILSLRDRALALFLLDTGARIAEVLDLTADRVDFAARTVVVNGKGRQQGHVFWSELTAEALAVYLAADPPPTPDAPLFRPIRGRGCMSYSSARRRLQVYSEAAGIQAAPHRWRRTCGASLLRGGASMETIRRIYRHADVRTTQLYLEGIADLTIQAEHEQRHSMMRRLAEKTSAE